MSKTQLIKIKKFLENKVFWNQNDIYHLSLIYQLENECYKEEKLLKKAAKKYPNWDYLKKRLAWHSRPLFHRDPSKSKLVPRKPLHLPRNPKFIPKKETLENLCFVTASGSDQPYFNLSIELLESIKATRWYSNIPIKILDCGLNKKDKDFLIKKFNAEIKDPGWDIHPNLIQERYIFRRSNRVKNGWKGCTARPFIHKHFPGYEFYFWLDTDIWVQDENSLDKFIWLAEKQGIGSNIENKLSANWNSNLFLRTIPKSAQKVLYNKTAFVNNAYCIRRDMAKSYAHNTHQLVAELKRVIWGFELTILNYTAYKFQENLQIFTEEHENYNDDYKLGLPQYDDNAHLHSPLNKKFIGLMSLGAQLKFLPRYLPLYNLEKIDAVKNSNFYCIYYLWGFLLYKRSKKVEKLKILKNRAILNTTLNTLHFRTFPWKNKAKMKKELLNTYE